MLPGPRNHDQTENLHSKQKIPPPMKKGGWMIAYGKLWAQRSPSTLMDPIGEGGGRLGFCIVFLFSVDWALSAVYCFIIFWNGWG
jgi:hypothetical protein